MNRLRLSPIAWAALMASAAMLCDVAAPVLSAFSGVRGGCQCTAESGCGCRTAGGEGGSCCRPKAAELKQTAAVKPCCAKRLAKAEADAEKVASVRGACRCGVGQDPVTGGPPRVAAEVERYTPPAVGRDRAVVRAASAGVVRGRPDVPPPRV